MFETDQPFRDIPQRVTIFMLLDHLGIQHKGRDAKMTCPYRDERTPGWSVFKQGSKWKDHVDTSKRGDVIDLYMEMHPGCEKKDALRVLATIGGMTLKNLDPGDLPTPGGRYRQNNRPQPLGKEIPVEASSLLAANVVNYPTHGVAHELLNKRKGISTESIRSFAIEGSIGMGLDQSLLRLVGATDEVQKRGSSKLSLVYLMGRGAKCRPLAETSHKDHWISGKASDNIFRGEALLNLEKPDLKVFITEGETDCMVLQDEMWSRMIHDSFVLAALGGSWLPDFRIARRFLKGREVFIIGDNDKAGHSFSKRLQDHLQSVGGCRGVSRYKWHERNPCNDIGEVREKNLMEKFIFSLSCKNNWV